MDGQKDGEQQHGESTRRRRARFEKWNSLRICLLISFVGSNQHWSEQAREKREEQNEQRKSTSVLRSYRGCSLCALLPCLAYIPHKCIQSSSYVDTYLLVMVVRVRQTKVVFFHEIQELTQLDEQGLALGTFLGLDRQKVRLSF